MLFPAVISIENGNDMTITIIIPYPLTIVNEKKSNRLVALFYKVSD